MKILQINDNYQRTGGAETYFFNLINLLKKKGHRVSVFAIRGHDTRKVKTPARWSRSHNQFTWLWRSRPPRRWRDTLIIGAPKGPLPTYFSCKIFNFKVYFKLKKFIAETKPDVIHLHNNYLAPFSILLAIRGHKTIQTVHDYMLLCPSGWMVKKNSLKICKGNIGLKCFQNKCLSLHNLLISYLPFKLRMTATKKIINKFISPSKKLKQYLENFGFQNVDYLPYFLNVKDYQNSLKLKKNGNILYIGRLVKEKGIHNLIKALPRIMAKVKQAHLTVLGDGPEEESLISLAKKLAIADKINFVDKVSHEKVKQFYQKANVVVIPSIWVDNSPNVVYEAFAAGRPVVASDRGGMSDFVRNGKTGFIFDTCEVAVSEAKSDLAKSNRTPRRWRKDLAKKIITILKDNDLFKKTSLNCRQFALGHFTPEKHYQKIMKIYVVK